MKWPLLQDSLYMMQFSLFRPVCSVGFRRGRKRRKKRRMMMLWKLKWQRIKKVVIRQRNESSSWNKSKTLYTCRFTHFEVFVLCELIWLIFLCKHHFAGHWYDKTVVQTRWQISPSKNLCKLWNNKVCLLFFIMSVYFIYLFFFFTMKATWTLFMYLFFS